MHEHPIKTAALFLAIVLVGVLGADKICFSNDLVEVRVSTDLKRVVVKAQEPIKDFSSFSLHKPSRLILDIPGCKAADVRRIEPPSKSRTLDLQVSGTRSGARLVLNFKGGAVPTHRVRRMDNCLIVFLGDWSVPAASSSSRHFSTGESLPSGTSNRSTRRADDGDRRFAQSPTLRSEHLEITSADVVGGLIVLKVAEKENPDRIYRIELGLNLDRLGFNSAGIRRVLNKDGARLTTGWEGSSDGAAAGSR